MPRSFSFDDRNCDLVLEANDDRLEFVVALGMSAGEVIALATNTPDSFRRLLDFGVKACAISFLGVDSRLGSICDEFGVIGEYKKVAISGSRAAKVEGSNWPESQLNERNLGIQV